jgi:hypothetical protein
MNEAPRHHPLVAPRDIIPTTDWYLFPREPVIYRFNDGEIDIYIGESMNGVDRVMNQLFNYRASEIWHKCTPPSAFSAWCTLLERWTLCVLDVVADTQERRVREEEAINDFRPLLNGNKLENAAGWRHRRYEYFQQTKIQGLWRSDAEYQGFYTGHPRSRFPHLYTG